MKRIFIMAAIILMAVFFVRAQEGDKSKNILDQVTEKTKSFKTIVADFSFTQDNDEMDIHEDIHGSIKVKGKKYVVSLPDMGMDFYSDGTSIWNYMEDGNQVTISNIEEGGNDLMDPANLFNVYEKGFESKFVAEETADGKVVYVIDLFPETDEHDVEKVTILVNKSTMMLQSAKLLSNDGNIYGIIIKKMETDKELPDNTLSFNKDKYPDIEVIDLR